MARSRNTADAYLLGQANYAATLAAEFGYLSGLTLSRASTTTYTVAIGVARNEDAGSAAVMSLSTAMTKSLSAWAAGTGNGSLDTGTIATSTWYHVHLIQNLTTGAVDVLLSTSATSPTMPTGYTARRRIGSILTNGSSQITNFQQNGDRFLWDVPVADVAATNPGTAAVTRTLTVPTGVVVFPLVAWNINNATSGNIYCLITALSQTDTAPSISLYTFATGNNGAPANSGVMLGDIPSNTSGQLRSRLAASGASDVLRATTHGWTDLRGKG